jgi:hypothetical protein
MLNGVLSVWLKVQSYESAILRLHADQASRHTNWQRYQADIHSACERYPTLEPVLVLLLPEEGEKLIGHAQLLAELRAALVSQADERV